MLAFFLRFFAVGLPPLSDEAEFGYAGYSVLHTGKSEYGQKNPLLFVTPYADHYPTIYSFTTIPFTVLFGLNPVSERLPSILFGTFSCLLVFFLVSGFFSVPIGLVSALLMAINPWSLYYSRQGRFEMIGIFFMLLGIVLFQRAVNKRRGALYLLSAGALGISMLANDASKIVIPLLAIGLLVLYWSRVRKTKKHLVLFLGTGMVFCLLSAYMLFGAHQAGDFTRQSLVTSGQLADMVNSERRLTTAPLWLASMFHNKATVLIDRYLTSFFSIFSLNWFFQNGAQMLTESISRYGQYVLFELPFFFIGIYLSFKKRAIGLFLLFWMMVANLPGTLTSGGYYTYRSVLLLPVPLIYSALGLSWAWKRVKSPAIRTVFIVFCVLCTSGFLFSLYFDYPVYATEARSQQRVEALSYATSVAHRFKTVYVAGNFEVLYAFMTSYDPGEFQNAYLNQQVYRGIPTITLGKFVFGQFPMQEIATPSAYFPPQSLVVADATSVPPGIAVVKKFTGPEPLRADYVALEIP